MIAPKYYIYDLLHSIVFINQGHNVKYGETSNLFYPNKVFTSVHNQEERALRQIYLLMVEFLSWISCSIQETVLQYSSTPVLIH